MATASTPPRTFVYGVDPGTRESALVVVDLWTGGISGHVIKPNEEILAELALVWRPPVSNANYILVVEQIESMGLAVGREVFETVWWSGRFHQSWPGRAERMPRRAVKLHLCDSMRAKDTHIRQALLDRYGGSMAIGKKKTPGPLYGVRAHEFAALAVALTFIELHLGGIHDASTSPRTKEA